jgi:hypothetical protein
MAIHDGAWFKLIPDNAWFRHAKSRALVVVSNRRGRLSDGKHGGQAPEEGQGPNKLFR